MTQRKSDEQNVHNGPLTANPLDIHSQYERQIKDLQEAYGEAMLEPIVEPLFHEDSYGYRPGKSAHQALAQTRRRSWRYAWVVEIDIKGFFDNIDHALLLKAVRHHTRERWVVMYIERWLRAPVQMPDGTIQRK